MNRNHEEEVMGGAHQDEPAKPDPTQRFEHAMERSSYVAPPVNLMPKATRAEVYTALDSERDYQDNLGKKNGGAPHWHSPEAFLVYILSYYLEAVNVASREWTPTGEPPIKTLDIIRKITALGVACLEQHGAPQRKGYEREPLVAVDIHQAASVIARVQSALAHVESAREHVAQAMGRVQDIIDDKKTALGLQYSGKPQSPTEKIAAGLAERGIKETRQLVKAGDVREPTAEERDAMAAARKGTLLKGPVDELMSRLDQDLIVQPKNERADTPATEFKLPGEPDPLEGCHADVSSHGDDARIENPLPHMPGPKEPMSRSMIQNVLVLLELLPAGGLGYRYNEYGPPYHVDLIPEIRATLEGRLKDPALQ